MALATASRTRRNKYLEGNARRRAAKDPNQPAQNQTTPFSDWTYVRLVVRGVNSTKRTLPVCALLGGPLGFWGDSKVGDEEAGLLNAVSKAV